MAPSASQPRESLIAPALAAIPDGVCSRDLHILYLKRPFGLNDFKQHPPQLNANIRRLQTLRWTI